MIHYEWDYETIDEHGDIINHTHAAKLADYTKEDITPSLVLIRDSGNEAEGLQERTWAYVTNGVLPGYFQDAAGCNCSKVPAKFHKELELYLINL